MSDPFQAPASDRAVERGPDDLIAEVRAELDAARPYQILAGGIAALSAGLLGLGGAVICIASLAGGDGGGLCTGLVYVVLALVLMRPAWVLFDAAGALRAPIDPADQILRSVRRQADFWQQLGWTVLGLVGIYLLLIAFAVAAVMLGTALG